MGLHHGVAYGAEFFLFRLIYGVVIVLSDDRLVGRYDDNVHSVDIPEFLFLGLGRTGHAGFLIEFVEEVLEGNGGKRTALPFDLHVFLRLYGLMETVGITASRHYTSGKLVYDHHLTILYYIILIPVHRIVGAKGQDDAVLYLKVFRIGKVIYMEELLDLLYAFLRKRYVFLFFIVYIVAGLLDLLSKYGVDLGKFRRSLSPLHLPCKHIAGLIKLGALSGLSGNDKRRPGFIYEY